MDELIKVDFFLSILYNKEIFNTLESMRSIFVENFESYISNKFIFFCLFAEFIT
jgi:hypothetical protein